LTSLLDSRLAREDPGDAPAELRGVANAMADQRDRPDLDAARAMLARVPSRARRKELSAP
jgi:hypothetical protein